MLMLAGIILTDLSTKLIKYMFRQSSHEELKRPRGAKDCDIFCRDGNVAGRPGMPSGHMASLSFAIVFMMLAIVRGSPMQTALFGFLGLVYIVIMGMARYIKDCHTMGQIIAGAIWGALLAVLVYFPFAGMIHSSSRQNMSAS
jgi:membrane-associated phospholipid phosphatase